MSSCHSCSKVMAMRFSVQHQSYFFIRWVSSSAHFRFKKLPISSRPRTNSDRLRHSEFSL